MAKLANLAGAFPWYFGASMLKLIPREMSMFQIRCAWGLLTASLIGLIFVASRRSTLWRHFLAGGLILSSGLALLAFLLIAA